VRLFVRWSFLIVTAHCRTIISYSFGILDSRFLRMFSLATTGQERRNL
jgi:hypothetical protein